MSSALDRIEGAGFCLRPWQVEDEQSLLRHANHFSVARYLSDRFPHPYTAADAKAFLEWPALDSAWVRAIEINGEAVGGVGIRPGEDVHRLSAQIGYWLSPVYASRGIMSRVVPLWCDHLFNSYGFERLQALVFANNPASSRVLEKSGFVLEGIQRRAVLKNAEVLDALVYAKLRAAP